MDWQARTPDEGARHWSPAEGYAPASVLLRMLAEGWQVVEPVEVTPYWYSEGRHIDVFTFSLARGDDHIQVPVLGNPVVCRLIEERQFHTQHQGRIVVDHQSLL